MPIKFQFEAKHFLRKNSYDGVFVYLNNPYPLKYI